MPPLKKSSEIQYLQVSHAQIQPTMNRKYSEKKIPKNSRRQNLNFPASNYIVFATIYIVLGI